MAVSDDERRSEDALRQVPAALSTIHFESLESSGLITLLSLFDLSRLIAEHYKLPNRLRTKDARCRARFSNGIHSETSVNLQ